MKSARQICKKQNNELRFFALSSWAEGRGWELHGIEDYFLDICGCLLMDAYNKDANKVCEKLSILNAKLKHPRTPRQLATILRRKSVTTPYTYRNDTIIERLDMTRAEGRQFKRAFSGNSRTQEPNMTFQRLGEWAENRSWDFPQLSNQFLVVCGNLLMATNGRDKEATKRKMLEINRKLKSPLDDKTFKELLKSRAIWMPSAYLPSTIIEKLQMSPNEALTFMKPDVKNCNMVNPDDCLKRLVSWAKSRCWDLGYTRGSFFRLCGICLLQIDSRTALAKMRELNRNLKLPMLDSFIMGLYHDCVKNPVQKSNREIAKLLDMTEKELEVFESPVA